MACASGSRSTVERSTSDHSPVAASSCVRCCPRDPRLCWRTTRHSSGSGFRLILERDAELEVVGEAEDGRRAVELARETRPTSF